jgi:hypothetical protein
MSLEHRRVLYEVLPSHSARSEVPPRGLTEAAVPWTAVIPLAWSRCWWPSKIGRFVQQIFQVQWFHPPALFSVSGLRNGRPLDHPMGG